MPSWRCIGPRLQSRWSKYIQAGMAECHAYHASSATPCHNRQAATVPLHHQAAEMPAGSHVLAGTAWQATNSGSGIRRSDRNPPEALACTSTHSLMPKHLSIGGAKRTDAGMLWLLERSWHGCSCRHPRTCDVQHAEHRHGPRRWLGPLHRFRAVAANAPSATAPGAHTPLQAPIASAGCRCRPPCLYGGSHTGKYQAAPRHTQSVPCAATLFMLLQSAGRGVPAHA